MSQESSYNHVENGPKTQARQGIKKKSAPEKPHPMATTGEAPGSDTSRRGENRRGKNRKKNLRPEPPSSSILDL